MSLAAWRSNLAGLAQMAADGRLQTRLGLVSSYDGRAGKHLVKVRLQPEDIETGWLPIKLLLPGAGWGIYAGPATGDQAVVQFVDGDINAGVCTGFLGSDEDPPPAVASGEIHVRHKDAASLVFKAGGVVELVAPGGYDITANTTIHGTLHVTEDVTADKTVRAATDVVGGGKHLKTHTHTGVTAGGGTSGPPS